MSKVYDYADGKYPAQSRSTTPCNTTFPTVAKHNTAESCWVVLYGAVYDVTRFLPSHPGGVKAILRLAGQDATEEYDPVHPPGVLEEYLRPEERLGVMDRDTLPSPQTASSNTTAAAAAAATTGVTVPEKADLDTLLNLDEIEQEATKQIGRAHV